MSGVAVEGMCPDDYALMVVVDDPTGLFWISPEHIEFDESDPTDGTIRDLLLLAMAGADTNDAAKAAFDRRAVAGKRTASLVLVAYSRYAPSLSPADAGRPRGFRTPCRPAARDHRDRPLSFPVRRLVSPRPTR